MLAINKRGALTMSWKGDVLQGTLDLIKAASA